MITQAGTSTERRGILVPPNMPKERPKAVTEAMDRAKNIINTVEKESAQPLLSNLAGHIKSTFEAAKSAKTSSGVDDLLVTCLNLKNGKYDSATLSKIREATPGGSEVFMMLTNVKSRACEAILRNTMMPAGTDKPWGIDPTSVPELPQAQEVRITEKVLGEITRMMVATGQEPNDKEIEERQNEVRDKVRREATKQAKLECRRMEHYVEDQLQEGKFYDAFSEFLTDISTFPTAFVKGPVIRNRPRIVWTYDRNGSYVPAVELRPAREYYRPSPFDMYPSPGAKTIQDGSLCEHHRLRRSELNAMIGVPGFNDDAIRAVLDEYGKGGLREWVASDTLRAVAEGRPDEVKDPDPVIDAIEYWGFAQGKQLIEWGMTKKDIPDPEIDYQICAWLIGTWVIMARLNRHPLKKRPYYAASYSSNNDSIWGLSPPLLMKDTQNICNAVVRAMVNRIAFASGPIAEIFTDRLAPGEDPTHLKPWMLIKTKSDVTGRASSKAFYLTEVDPKADIFLKVFQHFFNQASEQTGIPNYIYGQGTGDQKSGHKTSSGLAMLMNATNALLRNVILGIDKNIIKPIIYEHWLNIMMFDRDVPKSGDINIIARASEYLIAQEQIQIRRIEALQNTNNAWDERIIGDKGRAAMLRESFKSMHMDVDEIVPPADEMEQREREMIQNLLARVSQLEAMLGGGRAGTGGTPNPENLAVVDNAGGQMGNEPGRMMQ